MVINISANDRAVKCPLCDKWFKRSEEDYIHYKKNDRYYHRKCFKTIEQDLNNEEKLRDYIKQVFNIDRVTPLMNRQIRKYVDDEDMTYSGIHGSLVYFLNVEKGKLEGLTLGIIPYVYDRAAAYYRKKSETKKRIDSYEGKAVTITNIVMQRPKPKPRRTMRKIIDMEEVE